MARAPLVPREYPGLSEYTSPVTTYTLKVWDSLHGMGRLAPFVSPLAPLGGFPWFTPGEHFFPSFAHGPLMERHDVAGIYKTKGCSP